MVGLASCDSALLARFGVLLLDLDGTLHRGPLAVPNASEAVVAARAAGVAVRFVTNNASRTPAQVVEHLRAVGVEAADAEVLTSAQAAARALAQDLERSAPVLVVGGDGLREAVAEVGLRPVGSWAERPQGVVQGWAPTIGWPLLAEAAYALAADVPWTVTNADLTLPTAQGQAPGNGAFVAMLSAVTGRTPDLVVGKPGPGMYATAARSAPGPPLAVGDRLDTDVAGAVAGGLDSLLVLTGVSTAYDVLTAPPSLRPTFVAPDLAALALAHPPVLGDGGRWRCGTAEVVLAGASLVGTSTATEAGAQARVDLLRAVTAAAWDRLDSGQQLRVDDALLASVG